MSVARGRWRLYVALLGTTEAWPECSFGRAVPIPTPVERVQALSRLGFEPLPDAEWEWSEYSQDPEDLASPVGLIATLRVRSRAEERP
ncbi:hypothetical protein H8N01_09290 [Streptomyces sp. AC536]|nr:hypothetical protein [Streptomyces buecherae]QNJ44385.1 hypothetical protein H7H31_17045 [Streptomyces buecherae]